MGIKNYIESKQILYIIVLNFNYTEDILLSNNLQLYEDLKNIETFRIQKVIYDISFIVELSIPYDSGVRIILNAPYVTRKRLFKSNVPMRKTLLLRIEWIIFDQRSLINTTTLPMHYLFFYE